MNNDFQYVSSTFLDKYDKFSDLILSIIHSNNIAGVFHDVKFADHLINQRAEIVLMEEWTSNSLS